MTEHNILILCANESTIQYPKLGSPDFVKQFLPKKSNSDNKIYFVGLEAIDNSPISCKSSLDNLKTKCPHLQDNMFDLIINEFCPNFVIETPQFCGILGNLLKDNGLFVWVVRLQTNDYYNVAIQKSNVLTNNGFPNTLIKIIPDVEYTETGIHNETKQLVTISGKGHFAVFQKSCPPEKDFGYFMRFVLCMIWV